MVFSKAFPSRSDKSAYTRWVDVALSEDEEEEVEKQAWKENGKLMRQCLAEARKILVDEGLKSYQTDQVNLAIALFEKYASHTVYWKEEAARDKFERQEQP